MTILTLIRNTVKQTLILLITLIFMPSIPILIFLGGPIYLLRYVIQISAKFFRPDLCKILTTRSAIFAVDNLYSQPRAPLLVYMTLEGRINIPEAQVFLSQRLVEATNEAGNLLRPELTQYISRWMGFYFWKRDPNFDISHHVHEYDGPGQSEFYKEDGLYEIVNGLVTKPFAQRRSPWEFIIFPNSVDENGGQTATGVVLLLHHALADGFSILKLVGELITSKGRIFPELTYRESTGCRRFLENLGLVFRAPYDTVKVFFDLYDSNEWHIPERKLSRKMNGAVLDKVPVEHIKEIKNLSGCTFTSVLLAAFSGAIRKFMLEQGAKVPKTIHCIAPLPMMGHPDKMRNFMTLCWVTLPIGISDPIQRLKTIEKHLTKLKRATFPIFAFVMIPFVGALFPFLTQIISKQLFVTAIMSNFPGPPDEVFYQGIRVSDMIFTGGMLPGNIGLGLASISYNGYIRIAAGIDESIVPASVPVRALVDKVSQELDLLKSEFSV